MTTCIFRPRECATTLTIVHGAELTYVYVCAQSPLPLACALCITLPLHQMVYVDNITVYTEKVVSVAATTKETVKADGDNSGSGSRCSYGFGARLWSVTIAAAAASLAVAML